MKLMLNKLLSREGFINRLVKGIQSIISRKPLEDNIFIPTAALQLFSHINHVMPIHHMILADFDSFIMPRV